MEEMDDITLLREYVERNSEEAFAELVTRHVNKVYSVALRHTGNPHQAEEITQAVFVILARKAPHLGKGVILEGWLYQTARLTALTFVRSEIRRARREQEAYMQTESNENEPDVWKQIAPLLDIAMAGLNEADRHAVVLRFFYGQDLKDVGAALGIGEDTARMRINRAIERLRKYFFKHGVTSTTTNIAETISANSVQAAPVALAKTATAVALAKGATASASTLTLIKGALKIMAWTKMKTAVLVGAVAILAIGTTTVAVREFKPVTVEDVFKHYSNEQYLKKAPAVAILRPTQYGNQGSWINGTAGRILGRNRSMDWVLGVAYDSSPERMVLPPDLPIGGFDYLLAVAGKPQTALQEALRKQFGLVAHTETRLTNVLVLKVNHPGAQGLKINRGLGKDQYLLANQGDLKLTHLKMSDMAAALGGYYLNTPVIDETGLADSYDVELRWDGRLTGSDEQDVVNQVLQNTLGLELVPEQRSIDMVVAEYSDGPSDYTPRAGSDLQGYWKGLEQMGADHLWPVRLKITEPSDGHFRAQWRRPWLNSRFVPASKVIYNAPKVKVEVAALPGVFEGEINSAHTEIKGTWTYKDQPAHPVTLTLTDLKTEGENEAAFDARKNFYNNSPDDPVGHWAIPNNSDIALEISRLPDGKLFCSMVRDGWEGDIDATLVQYTAPVVHIEWGWRGVGTFDGKIENGKLVGTWQQGRKGTPQPIAFERGAGR